MSMGTAEASIPGRLGRPKKRWFVGFLSASILMVGLVSYGFWHIGYLGLENLHKGLSMVLGVTGLLFLVFMLGCVFNMVLALKGMPFLPFFQKQTYMLIRLLFPLAVRLGGLFGMKRRQLEASFIAVSNLLFARRGIRVPADRLLVITPHCLQLATCPHKITRDPNNCKRCGGCNIGDLVKLSEEMGFHFFVATGGTLARQIVMETRPKAVLAIACERDLMSGIQDVYPLPAVGVLNLRPNGPCFNTKVDMEEVRTALEQVILKKE